MQVFRSFFSLLPPAGQKIPAVPVARTSPAAGARRGEVAAARARQSPAAALRPCGQSCPSAPGTAGTMSGDAVMAQSQRVCSLDGIEKLMGRYRTRYYEV